MQLRHEKRNQQESHSSLYALRSINLSYVVAHQSTYTVEVCLALKNK